jgi:hypothetical protein
MTDTRPRVPLNGKAVDLAQLAVEVGAALSASDTEVVVADEKTSVSAEALQAALDAHVPAPPADPDADLAARVRAVYDAAPAGPAKDLCAALLGLNGDAAVAGRPADAGR